MFPFGHFSVFLLLSLQKCRQKTPCNLLYDTCVNTRLKDNTDIQKVKEQYFKAALRHFGVFVVKLHPLLDDTVDGGVGVVDKLESSDVGAAFPQICQVNVQETLRRDVNRDVRKKTAFVCRAANCHTVKRRVFLWTATTLHDSLGVCQQTTFISAPNYVSQNQCQPCWKTCSL